MPTDATRATAEPLPEKLDLHTVQCEVWHLYHLLDTVVDQLMEMDYVRDGKRDVALDRTAALAWIARGHAHHLGLNIDDNFHAIERGAA